MKREGFHARHRIFIETLMLSAALALFFQIASAEPPNAAKDLLSRSVAAMGGVQAATVWHTRIDTGLLQVDWPGWGHLKANCKRYFKKPDKMKIDRDFSAYDHPFFFTYYYNGGEGWMMVNLGVRQSPRYTKEFARQMRTIDGPAYYLTKCDTFFPVTNVKDDSLLSASDIDRIGVVDKGDTVLFDINKKSLLPMRRIQDSGTTDIIMEDYRDTGGIKMPYHLTVYQRGRKTTEYTWNKIEFNKDIPDSIFEEYRPSKKK
jgi:outer membrane lipoprotein-sorting protein